jgi:hypothetical protein
MNFRIRNSWHTVRFGNPVHTSTYQFTHWFTLSCYHFRCCYDKFLFSWHELSDYRLQIFTLCHVGFRITVTENCWIYFILDTGYWDKSSVIFLVEWCAVFILRFRKGRKGNKDMTLVCICHKFHVSNNGQVLHIFSEYFVHDYAYFIGIDVRCLQICNFMQMLVCLHCIESWITVPRISLNIQRNKNVPNKSCRYQSCPYFMLCTNLSCGGTFWRKTLNFYLGCIRYIVPI